MIDFYLGLGTMEGDHKVIGSTRMTTDMFMLKYLYQNKDKFPKELSMIYQIDPDGFETFRVEDMITLIKLSCKMIHILNLKNEFKELITYDPDEELPTHIYEENPQQVVRFFRHLKRICEDALEFNFNVLVCGD